MDNNGNDDYNPFEDVFFLGMIILIVAGGFILPDIFYALID